MLYAAEISFSPKGADVVEESGRFLVLVEAADDESSLEKIQSTILQAQSRKGLFSEGAEFRTAWLIEIEKLPEPGLLCFYRQALKGTTEGVEVSLCSPTPDCDETDDVCFFCIADDDDPESPMEEPFFRLDAIGERPTRPE